MALRITFVLLLSVSFTVCNAQETKTDSSKLIYHKIKFESDLILFNVQYGEKTETLKTPIEDKRLLFGEDSLYLFFVTPLLGLPISNQLFVFIHNTDTMRIVYKDFGSYVYIDNLSFKKGNYLLENKRPLSKNRDYLIKGVELSDANEKLKSICFKNEIVHKKDLSREYRDACLSELLFIFYDVEDEQVNFKKIEDWNKYLTGW